MIFAFYSRKKTDRKGVIGIRGKRTDLIQEEEFTTNSALKIQCVEVKEDAKVIVSLFGSERSPETLIQMARAFANDSKIEVCHFTEAPEQADLDDFNEEPSSLKSHRRRVLAMASEEEIDLTFDALVSYDIAKSTYDLAKRFHCEWILTEWGGKNRGTFTVHNPVGWLRSHLPSHLAIFRDAGVRYIRKILVVTQSNENDLLVLDTADHLATVHKANITVAEFINNKSTEDEVEALKDKLAQRAEGLETRTQFTTLSGSKFIDTIIEASEEYDLLVFGGGEHSFTNQVFGSDDDKIIAKAACSVMSLQTAKN